VISRGVPRAKISTENCGFRPKNPKAKSACLLLLEKRVVSKIHPATKHSLFFANLISIELYSCQLLTSVAKEMYFLSLYASSTK
jgi:hypothetical protein